MDLEMPLECPKCHHKMKVKFNKLKKGSSHPCPKCNTTFVISNDGFTGAKKTLDDFARKLKNLKF